MQEPEHMEMISKVLKVVDIKCPHCGGLVGSVNIEKVDTLGYAPGILRLPQEGLPKEMEGN